MTRARRTRTARASRQSSTWSRTTCSRARSGSVASLGDAGVVLRKVSPVGLWDGEVEYPYEAVTRIGFGGRYEEALGLAADAGSVSG